MTTSKIERIKAEMIEYRKVVEEQRKAGRLPNSLIRGKVIAINHIDSLINQLEEDRKMTYSNYCIVCPYCGDVKEGEYDHPEIYYEEGSHDAYCGFCDREYVVNTKVKYSYETEKIEELEE